MLAESYSNQLNKSLGAYLISKKSEGREDIPTNFGLNRANKQEELPKRIKFYALVDTFNHKVLWTKNLKEYNKAVKEVFSDWFLKDRFFAFGKTSRKNMSISIKLGGKCL